MIDFIFCLVPLVLVCTVFSDFTIPCQMLLMTAILFLHKKTVSVLSDLKFPLACLNATNIVVEQADPTFDSVVEEILRYKNQPVS